MNKHRKRLPRKEYKEVFYEGKDKKIRKKKVLKFKPKNDEYD